MENDWSMAIVSGCLWILTLPCESGPEHHRGWHLPPYLNPVPITFFAPFLFMFMILLPSGCEPWISLLIGLPTGFALLLAGFAFAEYRDSNRSRYVTFEYWEGLIQCLVLALIGIVVFGDVNSILGLSISMSDVASLFSAESKVTVLCSRSTFACVIPLCSFSVSSINILHEAQCVPLTCSVIDFMPS